MTYEALAADDVTGAAHPAVDDPAPELRRPGVAVTPEEALMGTPALAKGTDVRAWMQETETGLRPVTRVRVPEVLNGARREILLSLPTLSVLNLMDGRRSGAEVAQTLAERFAGSVPTDAAAMRPIVRSVIVDLAAEGAVELG